MIWFDETSPYERLKGKKKSEELFQIYMHIYPYIHLGICTCIYYTCHLAFVYKYIDPHQTETDSKTYTCKGKKIPLLLFLSFFSSIDIKNSGDPIDHFSLKQEGESPIAM